MTRKIKGIGLAFVAIAAMSMAAAGGAQASELHATTGTTAAIFGTGTNHQFTTDAGIVKCNEAFFEGLVQNGGATQTTAKNIELTARYTGSCNVSGLSAVIDLNGCKFTITGENTPALTADVDITGCTPGKQIVVTSATCTVTVPEQAGLKHITFSNTPGAIPQHDVHGTVQILNQIVYQTHGTCPNTASDHTSQTSNGSYTGSATFIAKTHIGTVLTTHNGHQHNGLNQNGVQVGLIAT